MTPAKRTSGPPQADANIPKTIPGYGVIAEAYISLLSMMPASPSGSL
jgi:hypothetical protein